MLKQICNHPELVLNKKNSSDTNEVCRIKINFDLICTFLFIINILGDAKSSFESNYYFKAFINTKFGKTYSC